MTMTGIIENNKILCRCEIDEDKWTGGKEISIQVGRDYWVASPLTEFLEGEHSDVEMSLIGMLSGETQTYDTIQDQISAIKKLVRTNVNESKTDFIISNAILP